MIQCQTWAWTFESLFFQFPGDDKQSDLAFAVSDENNVMKINSLRIISLPTLINLKLAAYKSLKQTRMKDRTDVVGLVKNLTLGNSFSSQLHESVRGEFLLLVEEVLAEENNSHEERVISRS